jgi:protein phosphatase
MHNLELIWSFYAEIIKLNVSVYEDHPHKLILPIIPFSTLRDLLRNVTRIFGREPTILRLKQELVIVGDIHGQILDLFRILAEFGPPPSTNYLFLGDLVDRGEFSTETAVLLLTMKALWPSSVFLIRGNHEFAEMWARGGFGAELEALYPNMKAGDEFLKAFAVMPLGAIVNDRILCLHGGIGPTTESIDSIAGIQRPIGIIDQDRALDILWSDPCDEIDGFSPSNRGTGHFFGAAVLVAFLARNGFDLLVRGHECEDDGFGYHLDGRVLTVFSASGYCNSTNNKSAVLIVRSGSSTPVPKNFKVLKWIFRRDVCFSMVRDMTRDEGAKLQRLPALEKRDSTSVTPRLRAAESLTATAWKQRRASVPPVGVLGSTSHTRMAIQPSQSVLVFPSFAPEQIEQAARKRACGMML